MSVAARAKRAVLDAGVLIHGHFIFADGDHATAKLEMDNLWEHPHSLRTVLELLAEATDLPPADVILGVPTGGQRLAAELGDTWLDAPVAKLERIPGGAKQDFRFITPADEALARGANSLRIYEDVVTTLSSIAGVVRLLRPEHQQIHSLAIWRRGEVKAAYRPGVIDHYLIEEPLPSYPPAACPAPDCPNRQRRA